MIYHTQATASELCDAKSDASQLDICILEMLIKILVLLYAHIYIYTIATRIIIIYKYMYTVNVSIIMRGNRVCEMLYEQYPIY